MFIMNITNIRMRCGGFFMENSHSVYILECGDGSLYTGYTNNLSKRMKLHEEGKGAKYTRGRGPLSLAFYKPFETKEEAMREEYRIKKLPRREKEKLVNRYKEGHE